MIHDPTQAHPPGVGRIVDLGAAPERRVVHTDAAPRAVGPYSQAIQCGPWVFTAGQVGLDPATGQLVAAGVGDQTRQSLANLAAVLEAAGASLAAVVKTTVFLVDMGDFAAMNAAYAEAFPDAPPARSTVAVAALPLGARVEVEAVASIGT
jgi:2-iminobutanoate/2-iminopropanoate deaminase